MKDVRRPNLTAAEIALFGSIVKQLKASGSGVRDSLILARLQEHRILCKKYKAHYETFDIPSQERASIFSGEIGVCKNPECGNYTRWKRPRYNDFCSAKCAGPFTVAGRKATCRAKYGVDYVAQVPEITVKRSAALRKSYATKGHAAPRKGKFEYVVPKLRPNTGTEFYVYVLLDPRKPGQFKYGRYIFDHEPFYVGKGKGGRAFDHLRAFDIERSSNLHKKNKIRAIVKADLEPVIKIQKKDIEEATAFMLEAKMIHTIGCGKFGPLTNVMRKTCDGRAGYKHTEATRSRLSEISKRSWANSSNETKQRRCDAISQAKGCITLAEYRKKLKLLPSGKITVDVDKSAFRMSHKLPHTCKCGHSWLVSPNHLLRVAVGCVACRRRDPELVGRRHALSVEAKAKTNLPQYLTLLKSTYAESIKLVEDSPTDFKMTAKLLHRCSYGHEWRISPKLLKRYRNGCPYCKTYTTRTAKVVNVGHI